MEALLNKIKAEFETFEMGAQRLVDKGNKTAGARSRKASLALDKLFKEWRKASLAVTES